MHAGVYEMPRDDGRENVLWVFEVEEGSEVEMTGKEVGVSECAGGMNALEKSARGQ